MSGFAQAMTVFASPSAASERQLVQRLLVDLLDRDGRVRFKSVVSFHDHISRTYGLALVQNATFGVREGGRHLFYLHGNVLLRVKTTGTARRPVAHMTISLATGLGWPDEVAKISRSGEVVPKLGSVPRADHRALRRLGGNYQAIAALDDRWAEACHFDFAKGFDGSGAEALPVR